MNLSPAESDALTALHAHTDIIKPAGKGSAVVVLSTEAYDAEVMHQLSDETFYTKLNHKDPTFCSNATITTTVNTMLANGAINKRTAED